MLIGRISSMLRFLIGILLLQAATGLITYTALMTDLNQTVYLFAALAGLLGFLVALWFDSVVGTVREQSLAQQHKRHQREREKLRMQAERERTKLAARKNRNASGAKLRTGIAVGGIVGVGVAMMMAQFLWLGLLTVTTAGGAALGYGLRVRQEKRIRARELYSNTRLIGAGAEEVRALEASAESPVKRIRRKKPKTDEASS